MQILIDHGCGRNFGDIAMAEAVIWQYLAIFPTADISVVGDPPLTKSIWDAARVRPTKTYDLHADAFDALHIAGGGNLTDLFPSEVRRRCALIDMFLVQQKPVILSGQQLGPFQDKNLEDVLMRALMRVTYIGVRDEESLKLCAKYGIPADRFSLTGDDSLGIVPAPNERVCALLDTYALQPGKFLAINVRMGSYVPEHEHCLDAIAALFDAVAQQLGLPMLFVPISLNSCDSDMKFAGILASRMRSPFAVYDAAESTASEAKGILGNAQSCLGFSWHFCMFALSQGVPAVCLYASDYYAQKGRGLCNFWSNDHLALSMGGLPASAAANICRTLDDTTLRDHLRHRSIEAYEEWRSFFAMKIPLLITGNRT